MLASTSYFDGSYPHRAEEHSHMTFCSRNTNFNWKLGSDRSLQNGGAVPKKLPTTGCNKTSAGREPKHWERACSTEDAVGVKGTSLDLSRFDNNRHHQTVEGGA